MLGPPASRRHSVGDALAYVIYTSGSTGRPKGAMISERAIVNRLAWMQQAFALGADDRVVQKTPSSFDVSVWEFFWPLLYGAGLVLARPDGHRDPLYLAELFNAERVTTAHFVPSMLDAFVATPEARSCVSLRRLIASGEALSGELAARVAERLPAPLFNLYGPTEAAVDVTVLACRDASSTRPVPIGRPISNTQIRVLDRTHRTVPMGVPGELMIGGVQLARGYLRRPGVTAATFVPDVLATEPGARLYKSGDLARVLATGELEFLGRLDHQVKLRGFRIELGEIEVALVGVDGVRQAVALVRSTSVGDDQLVAFVVGDDGVRRHGSSSAPHQGLKPLATLGHPYRGEEALRSEGAESKGDARQGGCAPPGREDLGNPQPGAHSASLRDVSPAPGYTLAPPRGAFPHGDESEQLSEFFTPSGVTQGSQGFQPLAELDVATLRQHLQSKLPEFMIPTRIVPLAELPLLPNGKVDRRRLSEERLDDEARPTFVAPRPGLEETVATTWSTVLGRERISADDHFFALGGHSLLAVKVVARLRVALDAEVPLRWLFEAPRLADLATRLATAGAGTVEPPLERRSRTEEPAPLSFAQERLFFLHLLEPESAVYNIGGLFRLGALDLTALEPALEVVTARHEALRTTFHLRDGDPVQVVDEAARPSLRTVDLRTFEPGARQDELDRLAAEEARRSFDLARDVLWRLTVVRLGDDEHALLLTVHHIIADEVSLAVLGDELATAYDALLHDRQVMLPELPIQVADHAVWQRRLHADGLLDGELAFWRERLLPLPEPLELPADRPRPAQPSRRGGVVATRLDGTLCRRLAALGERHDATLFMTLLAAFTGLLGHLASRRDVAVGTPVAGRDRVELEGLIGFFVNTLVLRNDVGGDPSFAELVERVRTVAVDAYAHQLLPFEKLVAELAPERDLTRSPLFQVMFVLQNAPRDAERRGARMSAAAIETGTAKFDLQLLLSEGRDGIGAALEYSCDLFDRSTARRFLDRYARLLAAVVEAPAARLSALPWLSAAERHQVLVEWNATAVPFDGAERLDQLLARQASLVPDRVAVAFGDAVLSYRGLDLAAGELAGRLGGLGVGREDRVALVVERSLEMMVGLLGILKAGAVYVPVDPTYPAERLAFMVADADVALLLAQAAHAERFVAQGVAVLCLDALDGAGSLQGAEEPARRRRSQQRLVADPWPNPGTDGSTPLEINAAESLREQEPLLEPLASHQPSLGEPGASTTSGAIVAERHREQEPMLGPPASRRLSSGESGASSTSDALAAERHREQEPLLGPPASRRLSSTGDELAYVLYTSGSTGRPKGAMISHRALINRLVWMQDAFTLDVDDAVLQKTPLGFDVSGWELFWPLLVGARLVVAPPEAHRDPRRLAAIMDGERITTLHFVPSMLRAFLEGGDLPRLDALTRVIVSGEALNAELVRRFFAALDAELHNLYGPTEAAIDVSHQSLSSGWDRPRVPIGRAISNTRLVILNRDLSPRPLGAPGELLIGGVQLARGYFGRAGLTAERFVPDPFGEAGTRLYRTGDLCRFLTDGSIDFLGRLDFQVKIRGVRVEPGEVEAALAAHPAVDQAVVVAVDGGDGALQLAACAVASTDVEALRRYLEERLPAALVPGRFVLVEALPLLPNGKVDRGAVAELARREVEEDGGDYVAPRGASEEVLALIWGEVLGRERVSADEHFFHAGGHSLLAVRLLARLRARLGVELPLGDVFRYPVLADLARRLDAARRGETATLPPIVPIDRDGELPLSFAQERLWFLDQLEPGGTAYNMPLAFRARGELDLDVLARALQAVTARHEVLRSRFGAEEGGPRLTIVDEAPVPLTVVDLTSFDAEERDAAWSELSRVEAQRPFSLAQGPLLRATVARFADAEHGVLLDLHHIVSDGWSLGILISELCAIYGALARGEDVQLRPLAVQYVDYAAWQRAWLQGEALDAELAFWRERLAGAEVLELPTDHPRPALRSSRGRRLVARLPAALSDAVAARGRDAGATPFMTLLAAFAALLARYSGQDDIVVGSPVAGRDRVELEGLIGFFVNNLVLRLALGGEPSFAELVAATRDTVLDAQAHQAVPFEKLVSELEPERDLSRTPLFQVFFGLQTVDREAPRLGELSLEPAGADSGTAAFDLELSCLATPSGVDAVLRYASELFEAATMERFYRRFETLLEAALASPDLPVAALSLFADGERRQLLTEGETAATPVDEMTVHALVALQAASTPEAVAVSGLDADGAETRLSYGELLRRAASLAEVLRRRGVQPEERVALLVERSPDMVAALLGTLSAGASYLPLDPHHPRERLAQLLADAEPALALTTGTILPTLPADAPPSVLIDKLPAPSGEPPSGAPAKLPTVDPRQAAYVIYTSGSTGKPKGVVIPHRAVVAFLGAMAAGPELSASDRLLAVTTLSFDIAVLELFLPLIHGAEVVVASREQAADGTVLGARLAAVRASVLQATPATWTMLVESGFVSRDRLKALCGGEALPRGLAARLLAAGVELWNVYGPTEATVWASLLKVEAERITLGRPLPGVRWRVADRGLRLQPTGIPGELLLGGAQLARGYLDRPALSAERFVPDPFAEDPGERLYRTGDLARTRADGEVEYLGRLDHQVKLRGFRIELGEIEAHLEAHPDVARAVVVLRGQGLDDAVLVAYLVRRDGVEGPLVPQPRELLAARLPSYMVPASCVEVEALPLSPSGKIDRKALAKRDLPRQNASSDELVAPRTPLEEEIAGLWSELLERRPIGVLTSFFELGGHSLVATRLIHRLRTAFAVDLPLPRFFAEPTVAGVAAAVDELRRAGETALEPLPEIVPEPAQRFAPFPLNDVQQAYWIGRNASFALGNVSSHIYEEIDLPAVDLGRLNRALRRLIDRHDMLRVAIRADGQQQIHESLDEPYSVRVLDLRGAEKAAVDQALEAVRDELSHKVLRTDRPPILDLQVTFFDGGARLHVGLDFLVVDALSMEILGDELLAFYRSPELELPPLELSFRDCVMAEKSHRESPHHRRAWEYWRQRLAVLPPAPQLPLAKSPRQLESPRFVRRRTRLPRAQWLRLKRRAAEAGLTPSALVLTAFAEVLAAWSKEPRFTVNVTTFNRPPLHPEIHQVVGDFTTLTLLAVELERGRDFVDHARGVQEQLWRDLEHRAVSGVAVLREMARQEGRAADAAMPVVFTSMLTGGADGDVEETSDVETFENEEGGRELYGISQTPQVWLDHQVGELEGGLACNWDVVEELFPTGLVDAMFEAYRRLLVELAEAPSWRSTLRPCLPSAELALRAEVNATDAPMAATLLHQGFERRAQEAPERPAVISPERSLTYGEIEVRANLLAAALVARGARPNALVAVVMEKSWQQVVAVLAILKAGAAYLPIDAALPDERRHHLLARGEAELAVTVPELDEALSWPDGVERLLVEDAAPSSEIAAPSPRQEPSDLAYVIFTSGSTGQPKGVMIDHRGALNTCLDINQRFAVGPEDRVLALSALNFDLSVYDIFGLLAAGGALVLPAAAGRRDPGHWQELLIAHRVTIWNTVPALMDMLARDVSSRIPTSTSSEIVQPGPGPSRPGSGSGSLGELRLVMMSGDWIPVALPDRLRALQSKLEVISLGGATEASIWSILFPIEAVDPAWPSIPYGKPMVNQRFYVLDGELEHRPLWVPGELYIGGVGVALGYWRDAEKTAASFVEHPRTGERLYRTGDLGRYLPSGDIEFLGREDFQVKIRGHRIELGEIEAHLEQHPAIVQAVAAVVGEGELRRLAAFYVARDDASPDELGEFLNGKLPDYMVPASFVALGALPLTANGKVDRGALVKGFASAPREVEERVSVPPRTAAEAQLAALWQGLLGLDEVGVEDSLFQLGGNSMTAIQILARLRESAGVEIPLRDLLAGPTIAELARAVEERRQQPFEGSLDAYAITPDPDSRFAPFPLNPVQQAYWVGRSGTMSLGGVSAHSYFELEMPYLEPARLNAALRRLVERHDMLRAIVLPDGRQQVLAEVPPYEVEVLDLRTADDAQKERALGAIRDRMSHQVLPADRWPLFEIRVTRLGDARFRLHLSFDILMIDAWSFRLLTYESYLFYRDPAAQAEPLELSFRDYVLAEEAFRASTIYQRARDYWLERLPTLPPAPDLPLAKSPTEVVSPRFVRHQARLDRGRWRRLQARAADAGLTASGLLIAAFSEILALWSKEPRFTINITTFNRLPLHPQVNEVVGDFTSLTLLEIDTRGGKSFAERARGVQQRLWDDLEHRSFGGVEVMRELIRRQGSAPDSLMPVVFTSVLFGDEQNRRLDEAPAEEAGVVEENEAVAEPEDDGLYHISQTPQVWLDHQVGEADGQLVFNWDVVEELFPPGLVARMFETYQAYLVALADGERLTAVDRPVLPAAELAARILANDTAAPVPSGLLHQGFEERAALHSERPAVIAADRVLTYGELEHRANHLAWRLRESYVKPNELVAVVIEKSWRQIVAVMAILKAGAAYLPIDPELPDERRDHLLAVGEVAVALTAPHLASALAWPGDVAVLTVDDEEPPPGDALDAVQSPGDLAYVIFTSGSTGQPKGVMIDHRGALNTCDDVNQRFGVGAEDRVLALSNLNFDLSVYDVFGLLAAGGALVMPEPEARRDPGRWLELIAEHRVTVWNTVPALMEMLARYAAGVDASLAPLRLVLMSGDWIPISLPEKLWALSPELTVISLGGATEASIWSILHPITAVEPGWTSIPYGRAMRSQTFHVLDAALEPRPVWVPGELYIGGVGVALGYWRDAEKTAASFVEHPRTGERYYRTGDLGRFLPSGDIEFLGREDFQVKIRGHRIELGEIEAALEQHPRIRQAVVQAVGPARQKQRLAAYAVLESDAEAERLDLPPLVDEPWRAFLAAVDEPSAETAVDAEALGQLLGALRQLRSPDEPLPRYRYASAGHLYPIQAYVHVADDHAGLRAGLYYHDPQAHRLVRMGSPDDGRWGNAACTILLVARLGAIAPMYGAASPELCLLEAGYIAELLHLVAAAQGLDFHAVVLPDLSPFSDVLELDDDAFPVHAFAVGGHDELATGGVAGPLRAAAPPAEAPPAAAPPAEAPPTERKLSERGVPKTDTSCLQSEGGEKSSVARVLRLRRGRLSRGRRSRGRLSARGPGNPGRRSTTEQPPQAVLDAMTTWLQSPQGARELDDPVARVDFKLRQAGLRQLPGRDAVALAPQELDDADHATFHQRQSDRTYLDAPLSAAALAQLLGCLLPGELDVYLHIVPGRLRGLAAGNYRYHPTTHQLELVSKDELGIELHHQVNHPIAAASAFTIFLVARRGAREDALREAGALGQRAMHSAPLWGLGLCPVSSVDEGCLRRPLVLAGDQVLAHALLGGAIELGTGAARRDPLQAFIGRDEAQPAPDLAALVADHHQLSTDAMRRFLGGKLPSYMVPDSLVILAALPLSANGKVDRGALEQEDHTREEAPSAEGAAFAAPRTPLEERFAVLWQELLGLERVGIHDRFFGLGGDSVQAIQFLVRAREEGIELSARDFFEHQTIASLAEVAEVAILAADGNGAEEAASEGDSFAGEVLPEELEELLEEYGGDAFGDGVEDYSLIDE